MSRVSRIPSPLPLVQLLPLLRSRHVAQAWVCCLSVAVVLALSDRGDALRLSFSPSRARRRTFRAPSLSLPSTRRRHRRRPKRCRLPTAAHAAFIEPISFSPSRSPPVAYSLLSRSPSPFVIPPPFVRSSRAASTADRPRLSNPLLDGAFPHPFVPVRSSYIWSVSTSHRRHVRHAPRDPQLL